MATRSFFIARYIILNSHIVSLGTCYVAQMKERERERETDRQRRAHALGVQAAMQTSGYVCSTAIVGVQSCHQAY
jgi:hypothetical protein